MNVAFLVNPALRRQFDEAASRRLAAGTDDPASLAARQLAAVRAIWQDAVNDVPYYADLVRSGRAPAAIHDWTDIAAMPVLTRRILQERPLDFIRRSGPPESFLTTAGSTGTPLRIGMTQAERDLMRVVKLSAWQDLGYQPSSRLFLIWGHSHLLGTGLKGRLNHLRRRLVDVALGYKRVDAYRLTTRSCAEYAAELIAFRPSGLIGYAAALDLFARYTPTFRDQFRACGLKFVLSTAEAPPRPDSLALLENHFGCPVVQEYGGAEFGQVAFKHGRAPFETYSDLNYVEVEPPDPGEPGSRPILLTSLHRRYTPLMRYRVGDGAEDPTVLAHGHVSSFHSIAGRVNDVILLGTGDAIHSVSVFHCVHQEPVFNIQLILRDEAIELCLVTSEVDRNAMEARIRGRLQQVHPALADVKFRYLEDLETNRSGKRRWFIDHRTAARQ